VVPECIRVDLTRHIASKLGDLQEEARYGFEKELGPCEDWTPIHVYQKMTRIVTLLSGRVFVGRPLSREEEWIDINISYTLFCVQARAAIQAYPACMRDIVAPYLKEVKGLWQFKRRGAMLLKPMIDEMLAKEGSEKLFREGESDEQGTMMSWILSRTPFERRSDAMLMGESQMSCMYYFTLLIVLLMERQCRWLPFTQHPWLQRQQFTILLPTLNTSLRYERKSRKC
jgi:hypothetical protein